MRKPLRPTHEVLEALEDEFSICIVELHKLNHDIVLKFFDKVSERRNARNRLTNKTVSRGLIALDGGIVAHEKSKVTDTDSVQCHDTRFASHAILDVIKTYEEGKWHSIVTNHRQGDTTIPPGSISLL